MSTITLYKSPEGKVGTLWINLLIIIAHMFSSRWDIGDGWSLYGKCRLQWRPSGCIVLKLSSPQINHWCFKHHLHFTTWRDLLFVKNMVSLSSGILWFMDGMFLTLRKCFHLWNVFSGYILQKVNCDEIHQCMFYNEKGGKINKIL